MEVCNAIFSNLYWLTLMAIVRDLKSSQEYAVCNKLPFTLKDPSVPQDRRQP